MQRVLLVRTSGLDEAIVSFIVSNGKAWDVVNLERVEWRQLVNHARKVLRVSGSNARERLAELLARYPQTMEYIYVTFLAVAPKFVVDQLVRHRLATWMVSSARHGSIVMIVDDAFVDETGVDLDALMEHMAKLMNECRGRRELCQRLAPPILDHRLVLGKLNLRELAHVYCYRKCRGGQRETVELIEAIVGELPPTLRSAVTRFCREWGYCLGEG